MHKYFVEQPGPGYNPNVKYLDLGNTGILHEVVVIESSDNDKHYIKTAQMNANEVVKLVNTLNNPEVFRTGKKG